MNNTTTTDQWSKYQIEKQLHDSYYNVRRPIRATYSNDKDYDSAMSKWSFEKMVNAPNQPGYDRANND